MRMPRRLPISCLLLLLSVAGTPVACAAPRTAAHKAPKRATRISVEALEEQWRQAQLAGDATAMDRLLADDYVGITAAGQINTKAMQLERMRNRSALFTQLDITDSKIKIVGQVAIVTSLFQISGSSDGKPLTGMFRSTQVFQHLPSGGWKITSFEATRVPKTLAARRSPSGGESDAVADGAVGR